MAARVNWRKDMNGACTGSNWWTNLREERSGPGLWPGSGSGSDNSRQDVNGARKGSNWCTDTREESIGPGLCPLIYDE